MRVHKNQFPELYELFVQQAKKLGVDKANLYIIQDPYLNANTIGLGTCSVVLNSALVEQLSTKELAFVIAHELGHYAAGHTKISSILIPIGNNNTITNVIFGLWQRQAEYTADRCGLIVNQDLDSAITAIINFTQLKKADTFSTSVTAFSLNRPLITSRVKKIIAFWKENFTNKTTKEYQTN
jgi:Zn-dependent protease with chaperone function